MMVGFFLHLCRCLGPDEMEPLCSALQYRGIVYVIPLANFGKTEFDKDGNDFIGREDRNITHNSSNGDVLNPDKPRLQYGFTILLKHCNNIAQILVDFIKRFSLRMSTGATGNKTNEQASLWAPLNYRRIDSHGLLQDGMESVIIILWSVISNSLA